MQVIEGNTLVEDRWTAVADDAALPDGPALVSFARWVEDSAVRERPETGVIVRPEDAWQDAVPALLSATQIAIRFDRFADGRGYSIARLLRERHGYQGTLRASGDVLRDQVFYLRRCGFDVLEIRGDKSSEDALKALKDFSVAYQPAAVDP